MAHLTTNKIFTPDIERISIQGSSPLIKVPLIRLIFQMAIVSWYQP